MDTQNSWTTDRLLIQALSVHDNNFILELVNTDRWIKFIGNRNIHSPEDATAFIQKIINNQHTTYWTVKLKETGTSIGIVSFIKRDYLEHPDIGFAFLPNFSNKGYAYEATKTVLSNLILNKQHTHILATTVPKNISSIKLLKKLGLQFDKVIEVDKETLHVYTVSTKMFHNVYYSFNNSQT